MTEVKKTVWIPIFFHKELKIRSIKKESTIEEELVEILSKEFPNLED